MRNFSVTLVALGYCVLLSGPFNDASAQDRTPSIDADVTTSGLAPLAGPIGTNTDLSNAYPLYETPITNPVTDRIFESVGQSMGSGPLPPPAPPAVIGYACREVNTFIIGSDWLSEIGTAPPGYTDPYHNAIQTYRNAMNSINSGAFRTSDVPYAVAPAKCSDPEGACNCVSAELQNSQECMKTVHNQSDVSVCVLNLYDGVRWCVSHSGFCG